MTSDEATPEAVSAVVDVLRASLAAVAESDPVRLLHENTRTMTQAELKKEIGRSFVEPSLRVEW
jgi:hypothetical protein